MEVRLEGLGNGTTRSHRQTRSLHLQKILPVQIVTQKPNYLRTYFKFFNSFCIYQHVEVSLAIPCLLFLQFSIFWKHAQTW